MDPIFNALPPRPGELLRQYTVHMRRFLHKEKCTVSLGKVYIYVVRDLTHTKAPEGGAFDSQLVKSPPFPHPPLGWRGGAIH